MNTPRRTSRKRTNQPPADQQLPNEPLEVPQGRFQLSRQPQIEHPSLRAWDTADKLILTELADIDLESATIWILNDSFGALSVALQRYAPYNLTDSRLSQLSLEQNLLANNLPVPHDRLLDSLHWPPGEPDLVLLRIPKTRALLDDQLQQLKSRLPSHGRLIAGAMVKHLRKSYIQLFEKHIGPTHTSLARQKARLIFAENDPAISIPQPTYPDHYLLEGSDFTIINHANVFAREQLDIGTRLLLQHLPRGAYQNIVDLGCGNGVVGLMASVYNPEACIHFIDESYMAVASARATFDAAYSNQPSRPEAGFHVNDALSGWPPQSVDLIINNPPFHQQQVIGDQVARQMFRQSLNALQQGGELWVIGNRHLGYHKTLKHIFGNVEQVAGNAKFVILKSVKKF